MRHKLLARLLISVVDHIPYLKSFIYGPVYMEGTWIGYFGGTIPKWSVEHFEQKLSGIVIRGWTETADGKTYAQWTSKAVSVDGEHGILIYTYEVDVFGVKNTQQGIEIFRFERSKYWKAPMQISEYSADLIDGIRSENREFKISNELMKVNSAMAAAHKQFP
jgi:hypothetical protein